MNTRNTLPFIFVPFLMIGCGGGGGSDNTTTPPSPPVNIAPTVNAGAFQSVDEEVLVTLSGSGTDSDGSISSYQWSQTAGTTVSMADPSNALTTFTAPTLIVATTLTFELSITDDDGAIGKGTTQVTISPVNLVPITNAGSDQSVNENTVVTLLGSGSDSDGTVASYKWLQTSGENVTLSDSSSASTTFNAPSVHANTTFEFQLSVADNEGSTSTDIMSVEIKNVDGSFAPATVSSALPQIKDYGIVNEIIHLDLNLDGFEDLVLFSTSDIEPVYEGVYIQALVNKGDGTFTDESSTYFPNMSNPSWKWIDKAYLVDLNNDGLDDIVSHVDITNATPPFIRNKNGKFEVYTGLASELEVGGLIPIDIDNDGNIDLISRKVVYNAEFEQHHELRLLRNITGTDNILKFDAISSPINDDLLVGVNNSTWAYGPVVLDVNNDGFDDLVYGGPLNKGGFVEERAPIYVFLNSGNKTLIESSSSVFPTGVPMYTHVREMVAADIDNSGRKSIVIANQGYDGSPFPGENNAILKNLGNGIFEEKLGDENTFNYSGFTHSTTVGDIDNDGDIDIVYAEYSWSGFNGTNSIRILENDGLGNFTKRFFTATKDLTTEHVWTTSLLVDLNKDGYPELVVGTGDKITKSQIFWNDGAGNFHIDEL